MIFSRMLPTAMLGSGLPTFGVLWPQQWEAGTEARSAYEGGTASQAVSSWSARPTAVGTARHVPIDITQQVEAAPKLPTQLAPPCHRRLDGSVAMNQLQPGITAATTCEEVSRTKPPRHGRWRAAGRSWWWTTWAARSRLDRQRSRLRMTRCHSNTPNEFPLMSGEGWPRQFLIGRVGTTRDT